MSNLLFGNIIKQLGKREKILQLGCRTGNLARILLYSNYNYVRGVETTSELISLAQQSMSTRHRSKFIKGFFDEEKTYDIEYDTVICAEVFEYHDCDIKILKSVKKGAKIIFTVPGFPNEVFSRYFLSEKSIKSRYKDLIDILEIREVVFNNDFCRTYLVKCRKVK